MSVRASGATILVEPGLSFSAKGGHQYFIQSSLTFSGVPSCGIEIALSGTNTGQTQDSWIVGYSGGVGYVHSTLTGATVYTISGATGTSGSFVTVGINSLYTNGAAPPAGTTWGSIGIYWRRRTGAGPTLTALLPNSSLSYVVTGTTI